MLFSELDLKPEILKGLEDMKYIELTPVQEQTFPHILGGRDLLARAETGSGKTGACGVPLVQNVDPALRAVQALILVPTRELALQYVTEIADIARHTEVEPFAVYGGFSMQIQNSKLAHGVHIMVATPGRRAEANDTPATMAVAIVRWVKHASGQGLVLRPLGAVGELGQGAQLERLTVVGHRCDRHG